MTHTSFRTRSLVRTGISAMFGVLLVAATVLPANAGAPPSISSFNPGSGPVGTNVTIFGSNFLGTAEVTFNSTPAPGFSVDGSGTQITVAVPSGAGSGSLTVRKSEGTAVSGGTFTVTGGPTISSFSPSSGLAGTSVTINGTNFGGTTSVRFNGKSAAGFSVSGSGTQITATVPSGATTGKIKVTAPTGSVLSTSNFTVTSSTGPVITSFNPTTGPVGTSVTITGTRFTGVTQVKFRGILASYSFNSDSQVTATVPSGATTGKITVVTSAGSTSSAINFVVTTPAVPNITGFTPHSGSVGTGVTIYGSGFLGSTLVRFNGTAATSFVIVTNGKITTTVPSGATTGKISVTNPQGIDTSGIVFTVTGPKITSFSPTTGNAGTVVTIFGSSFTGVNAVKFNGTPAASFSFVNGGRVTAVVPSGATTGRITLSTPLGTATSTGTFTVPSPHQRSISLSLARRRLVATGHVNVSDGYSACSSSVPVVISRFRHGRWHWIKTTSTHSGGAFRAFIPDKDGAYRAKAKRIVLVNGAICRVARSNIVHRG